MENNLGDKGEELMQTAAEKLYNDGRNIGINEGKILGMNEGKILGLNEGLEKGMEMGVEKGIEKGMEIGKYQIVRNLLKSNVEIEVICDATGLGRDDILKLK